MKIFTNLFSLSKTLRFELRPIGKTLEYINQRGIIKEDDERALDYTEAKKIIDEYHKYFISKSLRSLKLDETLLIKYFDLINSSQSNNAEIENLQTKLYAAIVDCFSTQEEFHGKKIFKKELITQIIPQYEKDKTKQEIIGKINRFTTYFEGFNDNRENIYKGDGKKGSIAYRLINENLKRFSQGIIRFEKVKQNLKSEIEQLNKEFSKEINSKWGITDISLIFDIKFFNNLLTQGDIDLYNAILGAKVDEKNHIQGLNQYINLHNQQHKSKLPTLDVLYKQILSDKESLSWLPDVFEDDNEAIVSLKNYCELLGRNSELLTLQRILNYINEFDLNQIYISEKNISRLSKDVYGNWTTLNTIIPTPKKSYSIAELDEFITKYNHTLEDEPLNSISEHFCKIDKPFNHYNECLSNAKSILSATHDTNDVFSNEEKTYIIRELCDSIIAIRRIASYTLGNGDERLKDDIYYGHLIPIVDTLNIFSKIYDKIRNRATKKPFSTKKIKLNFNGPTLLAGWDKNKEQDNLCTLFRKEGKYYLGIIARRNNNMFSTSLSDDDYYEKMEYKQISGPDKMFPKVFFSKSRIQEFKPSEDILRIREQKSYATGPKFNLSDCHKFIDFYKESINKHPEWNIFNYKFSPTEEYQNIGDFFAEAAEQSYNVTFRQIPKSHIDKLIDDGEIYLFEIYNKDFSPNSKGRKNLHTMYWEALFSEENLKDVIYKLNGKAEIFYRKASINVSPEKPTHKKGVAIPLRSNESKTKTFNYDIQKDKRYTKDKFLFHVPITINFKAKGKENINGKTIDFIKSNGIKHIIGIDRGERNLLYVTMIDLNGNIVEQFSLNEIANDIPSSTTPYVVDYHKELIKLEKERAKERKNWNIPQKIADLKDGYMSYVVHKISTMMVKHSAIVVLENLNYEFKNSRVKVERQVYQKFEQKLIDKLNYYVDKSTPYGEPGNIYQALQLTPLVEISKIGTHCGFIFYIPASYTSNIDPATGFVNLFNTKYTNREAAKEFFSKFEDIRQSTDGNYEFIVKNYSAFNAKADETRQDWIISTQGDRIEKIQDKITSQWKSRNINLTSEFDKLFVDLDKMNLKESILSQDDARFFNSLLYLFKLTVQLRNSDDCNDYIISPIANKDGVYYDSRKCNNSLPKDADANGAYNIARKGLMVFNRCKNAEKNKENKYNIEYAIKLQDWLQYSQQIDK